MKNVAAAAAVIPAGQEFELNVSSDRRCFVLLSKADHFIAHLEGADAARFEADYSAVRRRLPHLNSDQTLAQLWNNGGYSWYAAQYAD